MQIERLFQYDDWANREEVARLRPTNIPPALRLLGHIIGAEWLWITRIRKENAKMAVWPELSLEQCAAELDPLRAAFREILQTVDRESKIDYRNSKGESWSNSVDDILTHVAMHGTYHRGQIATVVRQGGETPAYTDYIQAVRTGSLKDEG
jgi:uncharacterized damage-inducible protein DinB